MDFPLAGRNVLVTGATGLIGVPLVHALLARGARVRAVGRDPQRLAALEAAGAAAVAADLLDRKSIPSLVDDCSLVIHLAGAVNDFMPYSSYWRANVEVTRILAEACLASGVERFVFVSTVWVHGLKTVGMVNEESPLRPSDQFYADTKREAEHAVHQLVRHRGLPAIIIRPSQIYGPADRVWTRRTIDLMRSGRFFRVDAGKGMIQPLYADDAAEGIVLASERGAPGEVYILAGPRAMPVEEFFRALAPIAGRRRLPSIPTWLANATAGLLEWIARIFERQPLFTRAEILGVNCRMTYDATKARRELGFQPKVALTEGLREVEKEFAER